MFKYICPRPRRSCLLLESAQFTTDNMKFSIIFVVASMATSGLCVPFFNPISAGMKATTSAVSGGMRVTGSALSTATNVGKQASSGIANIEKAALETAKNVGNAAIDGSAAIAHQGVDIARNVTQEIPIAGKVVDSAGNVADKAVDFGTGAAQGALNTVVDKKTSAIEMADNIAQSLLNGATVGTDYLDTIADMNDSMIEQLIERLKYIGCPAPKSS